MSEPSGPRTAAERSATKLAELYNGFKDKFPDVPDVTVQELCSWMEAGASSARRPQQEQALPPVLVDVRTAAEQQVSVLPGPATLTQREFERRGPETFRGQRIVCYCTAGYRSGLYAAKLRREHGLEAFNLRGSILAWTQAGLPLTDPRDGSETKRVHVFSKDWQLQGDCYTPVVFQRPLLRLAQDAVGGWGRSLARKLTGRGGGGHGGGAGGTEAGSEGG